MPSLCRTVASHCCSGCCGVGTKAAFLPKAIMSMMVLYPLLATITSDFRTSSSICEAGRWLTISSKPSFTRIFSPGWPVTIRALPTNVLNCFRIIDSKLIAEVPVLKEWPLPDTWLADRAAPQIEKANRCAQKEWCLIEIDSSTRCLPDPEPRHTETCEQRIEVGD